MIKNKYQEALNELRQISASERQNKLYDTLQELVDKETPMKPIKLGDNKFSCKSYAMAFTVKYLKNRFISHTYCDVCGQKIDWSDEE